MNVNSMLFKTLSRPFYQVHTGFFFVVLYFAAGFLRANEHIAIAHQTASSIILTGLILILWTLYLLNSISSISSSLHQTTHLFLHQLALYSPWKQFSCWSIVLLTINLPVVLYSLFILFYAISMGELINAGLLIAYNLMSIFLPPLYYIFRLKKPYSETTTSGIGRYMNKIITKPYPIWYFIHLIRNKPLLLLLSKTFSILLIIGVFKLYETDDYDYRLLGLGVLAAFSSNIVLVFEYFQFDLIKFPLWKNIPFTLFDRIRNQFIVFALMSVPEVIVMTRYFPLKESILILIYLSIFGLFLTSVYYQLLLIRKTTLEKISKLGFYLFIGLLVLIQFHIPLGFLILLMGMYVLVVQINFYKIFNQD